MRQKAQKIDLRLKFLHLQDPGMIRRTQREKRQRQENLGLKLIELHLGRKRQENLLVLKNREFLLQECIIEGSGAIFAIGSIHFQPSIDTGEDDFLFIMSIEGGTHLQPNGDFYGSVAGHDYVEVWPGNNIIHNDSDILWNQFPDDDVVVTKILTYDIIDQ